VKFSGESIFRILGAIWQVFPDEILSQRKKSWFWARNLKFEWQMQLWMTNLNFGWFFFAKFSKLFFSMKKKFDYFLNHLDRSKIFRRIHFSHSWRDSSTLYAPTASMKSCQFCSKSCHPLSLLNHHFGFLEVEPHFKLL